MFFRLSEDPGVISVGQTALGGDSSSYHTAGTTPSVATPVEQLEVANISKEEEKTLEGPPGLTHPTTSNHETASHEMATLISTSAAAVSSTCCKAVLHVVHMYIACQVTCGL